MAAFLFPPLRTYTSTCTFVCSDLYLLTGTIQADLERVRYKRQDNMDQPAVYEIRVRGQLDELWSDWLEGLTIRSEDTPDGQAITLLSGTIVDQAALHGILARLRDLNVVLLAVVCLGQDREADKDAT